MKYDSFMEALKGKQHKIDKNKNGEIDSHDFKLLRKEESEESLDEIHRMKTKLNALDPVSAKSVARQKLSNLVKSGHGKGALIANKMRTLNMGDDIDQEDLDALHEVLSKDAEAGDWIHDFVHSTNPKFDGKSKKERINMALGAYYDTHKKKDGMSEGNGYDDNRTGFTKKPREDDEGYGKPAFKAKSTMDRPHTVHIDGKPWKKLPNGHQANAAVKTLEGKGKKATAIAHFREEAEELDEKSDQAKQNKTMKNMMDASRGAKFKLNNPVPDAEPQHKTAQAYNKALGRALRKEESMKESQQIEEGRNEGDVPFDKPYKTVTSPVTTDKSGAQHTPMSRARNLAQMALKKKQSMKEAVQKVDVPAYLRKAKGDTPLKMDDLKRKDTISDPENLARNRGAVKEEKDEQEYGYEGDMAMNQLATLTRCAEMIKETLKPDTDLPEWVQSKITLATDYIQTAADYLHSELEEAKTTGPVNVDKVHAAGQEPHEEKWVPAKKVRKEQYDEEGNVTSSPMTYKEFAMMLEYESKDGVYRNKGTYGGNYVDPEGADDADDKKPKQQPAVKRGRGRPAGAKSGARKITGTSKLFK